MRRKMVDAWPALGPRIPARFRSRHLPIIGVVLLPSTLALALSGCALPPAISIASLAVDAVSYMVTEKTVADHALSQFAQQDCAFLRGLVGDPVCIDNADMTDIAVASGDDQPADDPNLHHGHADDAEDDDEAVMLASAAAPGPADGEIALLSTASGPDGMEATDAMSLTTAARTTGAAGTADNHWEVPATDAEPVTLEVPEIDTRMSDENLATPDDGGSFSALSRSRTTGDTRYHRAVRTRAVDADGTETFAALTRSSPPRADERPATATRRQARRAWIRGPAPNAGLYYVIAHSPQWTITETMVRRFKGLTPTVISDRLDARATFRVVVGPFAPAQEKSLHRRIRRAGVHETRIIRVHPDDWFGLRPAANIQVSENTVRER